MTKSLILFLFFGLISQSAFCYVLSQDELNKIVKSKVEADVKNQLKEYDVQAEITISGVPNSSISTNENLIPKIELTASQETFQPIVNRRVVIRNSKNIIVSSFPINIQTKVYKDVLVTTQPIQYNQEITNKNTTLQRKEISRQLGNTISNISERTISLRNYQKDTIVYKNSLKPRATILKDSTVDIMFLSQKGIQIKLQGRALKDGGVGETILVRSTKYNKVYSATVNSENEVVVRI